MADPVVLVTLGGEDLLLSHITLQEVLKVKSCTGYATKREWFAALYREEPEAQAAALIVAKARKGETARFADVDFDTDTYEARFVDEATRQPVEPLMEKNDDGTLKLDDDGTPIAVLDKAGVAQWVFSDTGEPLPPTETS